MGSQNELNQLRNVFQIPDSVVIRTLPIQKILASNVGSQQNNFSIDQTTNIDPELYIGLLGTKVYCNIEFSAGEYETNTKGLYKQFGPVRYEAILLTVSQAKKIIKTEIQGRNGTVPEYIGMDDYQIQINGVIVGGNGHYPIDEVAALKKVLDAPVAIPVASTYLNNLGITSIIVGSYELGQEAGGYSYQTFSIDCFSFSPVELRLTNV